MEFLDYKRVQVNFIYSFSWDVTKIAFDLLVEELKETGWDKLKINQRPIRWDKTDLKSCYQPDMVSRKSYLHREIVNSENLSVVVPLQYTGSIITEEKVIKIDLIHNYRIFENGSGVCTLTISVNKADSSFQSIHQILRLSPNVRGNSHSFMESFLRDSEGNSVSLQEIYRDSLFENKSNLFPKDLVWNDFSLDDDIFIEDDNSENAVQSPFILTVAEIDESEYNARIKHSEGNQTNTSVSKEIGSIICKLTLDNRRVEHDFGNLSVEYIRENLEYDSISGRLMNLCLDERLYFAFSRRGAIALTPDITDIPGCFVVPSLLNLMEILRGRWHIGNVVNISLDKAISNTSYYNDTSPTILMDEIYRWRILYGLFLRDPVPYLFDGGSVTTIAELAEKYFWLDKIKIDTHRKFEALDKLMQDLFTRKRFDDYLKWKK